MTKIKARLTPALLLAAATMTLGLQATPASARMDCHAEYDAAKTAINKKNVSADHREAGFRLAQHAYDLCTVGDEEWAKRFFDKLRESGN
jgi:hypothetical protein